MAQPGDTTHRLIKIIDANGAGVTGLVLANFTFTAYSRGYGAAAWSPYAAAPALVEIGSGLYSIAFSLPNSAGWWRVLIEHSTHRVWNGSWEGELETQDWDSLYGSIVQPVATLSTSAQLGMPLPVTLGAYRWRRLVIPVKDGSGVLYTNLATDFPSATLRLSVRSKDQLTKWDAGPSATISAGTGTAADFVITTSGSTLTIEIPKDSSFFSLLPTAADSVIAYAEIVGDFGNNPARTQPVIRSSPWTITRREVGT
jgi:hypothetical protein